MFVLYKCILHSFVYLRNIFFPSDQSNFLEHGTKSCKSEERNGMLFSNCQRWNRGHKARGQGQGHKKNPRPRPRTAFPRTEPLEAKDRNARGQGPRTQAQVLSKKKKKKVFTKIFQAISTKKRFPNNFSSASQNFNNSKYTAVLEPRTGQFLRT